MINCDAIGNSGAAIHVSGGGLHIRNFFAADNEGPALQLENGAKVDIDGFTHLARQKSKASKQKKERKNKKRR
jgi:hypothetical protein